MTYASLFSGCGGADAGLCAAGLTPLWFCENAEKPSDVLRYRYPDVPNYGDITKLDPEAVEVPDVLWMSPPCQDISIAGNQDGLAGERSRLFYEAIRICRTLVRRGTSLVLMEQVPHLRAVNGGRDFASVIGAFLECGARDIGWRILDTQYVGIPQSRDRIFFAVDFAGERSSEILSFASGLCRDASPRRKAGEGVARAVTAGSGDRCDGTTATYIPVIAPSIHDGRGRGEGDMSPTLCTDHAGRPSDQCPVVVAPNAVRRITPTEGERLQGFEDDHTRYGTNKKGQVYELADTPRYRMIGNAVTSEVARQIGETVRRTK